MDSGDASLTVPDARAGVSRSLHLWLAGQTHTAAITSEHRHWLAQQVAVLVDNPRIGEAARADDEDNFGLLFEPALESRLMDQLDAEPDNQAARLYLTDDDFAGTFNAAARRAVYQAGAVALSDRWAW
jgi:hypothetical protein